MTGIRASVLDGWATAYPAPPSGRVRRLVAPALTVGALGALTLALHARDPHQHASWGLCPSAALGFWCPGCGGLRAVNDLTRGDVAAALSSNLLLVVSMPVVVVLLLRWTHDRWRGVQRPDALTLSPLTTAVVLVSVLTFTVLRNLPQFSYLAP